MANNYRPISMTSVCCKTLEHITCRHMLSHLENNKIISPLQHGFCNGHSCESQLILTMHDLMQNFYSKQQTDLVTHKYLIRNFYSNLVNMVSLVILTSGFSLSWCSESNKLLSKGSPLSHAPLTLEYLKVVF